MIEAITVILEVGTPLFIVMGIFILALAFTDIPSQIVDGINGHLKRRHQLKMIQEVRKLAEAGGDLEKLAMLDNDLARDLHQTLGHHSKFRNTSS